jgi:hypothetical protein|nr:MAG TPA: hypothetical protein [Caudoviricetes sp.]
MKKIHTSINSALLAAPIFAVPFLAMLLHLDAIFTIALYVLLTVVPLSISLALWGLIKMFGGYKND